MDDSLVCTTCNTQKGKRYDIRLHKRGDGYEDIDILLCDHCADDYLGLDWIERRVPQSQD